MSLHGTPLDSIRLCRHNVKRPRMGVTMRVLLRVLSLGTLLAISHVAAASADPILITDSRRLIASTFVVGDFQSNVQTPSTPFAPFVGRASQSAIDGLANANTVAIQRSSFGRNIFSASGMVDSSATGTAGEEFFDASATGSSLFDVEFDLTAPHRYSITGLMAVDRTEDLPTSQGLGEVDVSLTSPLVGDIVFIDGLTLGSRQLHVTGILPAGRHRFFVEAFTESVSGGDLSRHTPNFDVEFAVAPVPEPASMLLLGAGLLALASKWCSEP